MGFPNNGDKNVVWYFFVLLWIIKIFKFDPMQGGKYLVNWVQYLHTQLIILQPAQMPQCAHPVN